LGEPQQGFSRHVHILETVKRDKTKFFDARNSAETDLSYELKP